MALIPGESIPTTQSAGAQSLDGWFRDTPQSNAPSTASPPTGGLNAWFDEPKQAAQQRGATPAFSPISSEALDQVATAEGLTPRQRQMMGVLLEQESGSGRNAKTSIDGARGAGQILPTTFQQYAKPGERIDDPTSNLAVAARIIKDLGTKSGDDPARIATGYFSGPGNMNSGAGNAWRNDAADGNGKRVSSYVGDVLTRLAGAQPAVAAEPAPQANPIASAPKWAAVTAKPEYQALSDGDKQAAREAYFQRFIAPNISPGEEPKYREWFDKQTAPPAGPGIVDRAATALGGARDAIREAAGTTDEQQRVDKLKRMGLDAGVMTKFAKETDTPNGQLPKQLQAIADLPATDEFKQKTRDQWAAADPVTRKTLEQAGGYGGFIAKQLNSIYGDAKIPTSAQVQGESRIEKTDFDFDAQKAYNDPKSILSNPVVRGAVKGVEGYRTGSLGLAQFAADALGADDFAAAMKQQAKVSGNKTAAMGESGNFVQRNFEGAVSSIAQQLPALVGGAATGSEALVLGSMFAQTFGQEYGQAREAGKDMSDAAQRAAIFGSFEVAGEKLGLGEQFRLIRQAARGQPTGVLAGWLANTAKKELPGELFTTTGEFLTDKAESIGLNKDASFKDYLDQMADTAVQTFMQSGVMGAGVHAGGAVADSLRSGSARAGDAAEAARGTALNRWMTDGLSPAAATQRAAAGQPAPAVQAAPTTGRIEPTIGEEQPAPTAAAAIPAQTGTTGIADQDVLDYADSRYRQLVAQRDGEIGPVEGDSGDIIEGQQASAGLSADDSAELALLQQNRGDARALARQYGFDTSQPDSITVAAAANEAATSPENDRAQPTQAQKEAGNYKKGSVTLHGLDLAIENPQGSSRSGVSRDGRAWSNTLNDHYGYVRGTVGADGDGVDVFVGPHPQSTKVFVIDQIDPETGRFDEVKAMLGYNSQQAADAAYHANHEAGWNGLGHITEVPVDGFKAWLDKGDTSKAFGTGQFTAAAGEVPEAAALVQRQRAAMANYKTAAMSGDEAAAQAAGDEVAAARAALNEARMNVADRAQTMLEEAAATPAPKPKTEKQAREQRAAKPEAKPAPKTTISDADAKHARQDEEVRKAAANIAARAAAKEATKEQVATPAQTALIDQAVKSKIITPGSLRAERFRAGIMDATSGTAPASAERSYLEGHAWALAKQNGAAPAAPAAPAAKPKTEKAAKAARAEKAPKPKKTLADQRPAKVEYPAPMGKGEGAMTTNKGQRAVVDYMNGEITKDHLIEKLGALDLYQGAIASITTRTEDFTMGDIKKVMALQQKRGFNLPDLNNIERFNMTRDEFLGTPKITSNKNAADLLPRAYKFLDNVEKVPFKNGMTAKYHEHGAAVFDGDKVVASYNNGETLVVDKNYRRQGIAEELVYQWRTRYPFPAKATHRTKAAQAIQEKVWHRIEKEYLQPRKTDLFDIDLTQDGPLAREAEPVRVNTLAKLKALEKKREAGKLTDAEYQMAIQMLIGKLETRNDAQLEKKARPRERGELWLRERLLRAKRTGELSADQVDFALWALDQNPNIANDLGISLRESKGDGVAGSYIPGSRIINLVKGNGNMETVVHEIMHHTERMMPPVVQQGIVKEWSRAMGKAWKNGTPAVREALQNMMLSSAGDKQAYERMMEAFRKGTLNYDAHYQLVNASEYWAVNSSEILGQRADAAGRWVVQARQWLREMIEKIKNLLNLPSSAPVLAGLQRVLDGQGKRLSNSMLVEISNSQAGAVLDGLNDIEIRRAAEQEEKYNPDNPSYTDSYENLTTRPGTTESQKKAGRLAIHALAARIARMAGDVRSTGTVLGNRMLANFVAGKPNQLVGQVAKNPADLAALAQVYRDPRFETFRAVYMKEGVVVGEAGYTSRLPGMVALPGNIGDLVADDKNSFGADGYYIMHNHPSGAAAPSDADIRLTTGIASEAVGFIGHVVIDRNEYAVIDAAGGYEVVKDESLNGKDFTSAPELEHEMLGVKINAPSKVADLAKALQIKTGYATLVLTDRDSKVQLLVDIPIGALKIDSRQGMVKAKAMIRRMARDTGSGGIRVAVLADGANIDDFARLVAEGVLMDVVSADGNSLRQNGAYHSGDFMNKGAKTYSVGEGENDYGPLNSLDLRTAAQKAQAQLVDEFGKPTFSHIDWWDKSIGTQYHKAAKNPLFKKVFDLAIKRENAVSLTAVRAASLAPGFLPRIDDFMGAMRTLAQGRRTGTQTDLAGKALLEGTLDGTSVIDGKVWTAPELRAKGLNDQGIALYRQAREAIDASLDEVAAAEGYSTVHSFVPKSIREQVIDDPRGAQSVLSAALAKRIQLDELHLAAQQRNGASPAAVDAAKAKLMQSFDVRDTLAEIFDRADQLKRAGYTPLMRFGNYYVQVEEIDPQTGKTVINPDTGKTNTLYFSRFETEAEASDAYFREQVANRGKDNVKVSSGPVNDEAFKMYSGISPETLELFADVVGAKEATEKFYQVALSERSALKRRITRDAIEGYSENMPRVLANFITSNGKFAAQRYYNRDINNAIRYIPRLQGDVQKEAVRLKEYIDNPGNGGAIASALSFTWFLGGNIASALVNATQPVMMTLPYLSQFGAGRAAAALTRAAPYAMGRKQIMDADLKAALKRGSQEGKVDAQEIFHLYSVGIQGVASILSGKLSKLPLVGSKVKGASESARARMNALGTLWGMPFAMVEGFNRRLTFIAAWDVAKTTGNPDPYQFAVDAVDQTQGVYNKVNRPNWARGPVGRVVFTFAQFKIMNVEMLKRLATMGGPEGKKAAAMYLATLILVAGLAGVPYADDIDDIIDTVGQWLGYNTNMKRTKREWAYKTLGRGFGDLALYGVSAHLPVDIGGRMGLGNMFPATGILKPSGEGNRAQDIMELGGPAISGLGKQMFDAYDAASMGNYGKAAMTMMPTAIKNAATGAEMAATGKAKDMKGRVKTDVTPGEGFAKAIGLNPTVVAEKNRANMPINQDLALQKLVESSIVDQWAQGAATGNKADIDAAMARMKNWNEKNPETPVSISAQQLRAKVKTLMTPTDTRLIKGAPKEMRGRVVEGLKKQD